MHPPVHMEVSPLIRYALAWLAVGSGIWVLFDRAERTITPELRAEVSRRLRNIDAGDTRRSWPETFGQIFDAVFGARLLSWRCVRRSVVASLAAVTVLFVVSWARNSATFFDRFVGLGIAGVAMSYAAFVVCLSVFPGYASLLESRLVIRLMASQRRAFTRLALLIADLGLTVTIFVVAFYLGDLFLPSVGNLDLDVFLEAVALRGGYGAQVGIFLYSIFVISAWMWLFLFADFVLRARLGRVLSTLDIENKPLRSIGLVCLLGWTVLFPLAILVS